MAKVGFYVDGFNLYHAIDELGQPHLKWLDLRALGQLLLDESKYGKELARVVYCTAYKKTNADKELRQKTYVRALEHKGVVVEHGHFAGETITCRKTCRETWFQDTEKQSDVSLALSVVHDAYTTDIQYFYICTADSDQVATVRYLQRHFPDRTVVSVAPPGRDLSYHITNHVQHRIRLSEQMIEKCLLPSHEIIDGSLRFKRPKSYDPPPGWIPPNHRPSRGKQNG